LSRLVQPRMACYETDCLEICRHLTETLRLGCNSLSPCIVHITPTTGNSLHLSHY
jgi:hypothetical protein